ncbi:Probable prolyl 4-hydroxylase 9 [Linum grandiflorum]
MKTKVKRARSTGGLSATLLVCALFFLAGFYFSTLFSPVEILSWRPRVLYFPNFATPDQCNSIIEITKPKLGPSLLALREGESAESTKGTRTSSGSFVTASEDDSGTLASIERKIARATMIPTTHGEEDNVYFVVEWLSARSPPV